MASINKAVRHWPLRKDTYEMVERLRKVEIAKGYRIPQADFIKRLIRVGGKNVR
jgi:hypothetical protein